MTDGELKAHLTARARRFSADARRYRDDAIRVSDPQEEDALYRAAKQCEAWALALDNAAVALGLPASSS